jgi:hypothetical protein
VEIDRFIDVLKNYSETSEEEALEVIALREKYPYSQLLHTLSARMCKDHAFVNEALELQLAAVYAADRGILKDVMTLDQLRTYEIKKPAPRDQPKKGVEVEKKKDEIKPPAIEPKQEVTTPINVVVEREEEPMDAPDPGSLAEKVMHDLEVLNNSRHRFEMLFQQPGKAFSPEKEVESPTAPVKEKAQTNDADKKAANKERPHKESSKSRKQRIIEIAKALEAADESQEADEAAAPPKKGKKAGNDIIEEIETTKQELQPENERQKEQLEVIEQFIKTQPSISSKKDNPVQVPPGDLSSIKTGEFSDNIVSETLVEILVKQGKNDKAIEVLKKLIWKFPQKKAYFAAQIEELKK